MTTYLARYRTQAEYALAEFEADTPQQALQLARDYWKESPDTLAFESYDMFMPLDEIEISGPEGDELAVWQDEDVRLRLAARQLFHALQTATAALHAAPYFKAPCLNSDSVEIAALCEAALARAKPLGS